MKLIIAEKPALAKCIADAIPGQAQRDGGGFVRKGEYIIIPSFGHLLTLKMPEDYDPALKSWTRETLPIYFEHWGKKVKEGAAYGGTNRQGGGPKERLEAIRNYLKTADAVIHAADPDDEGQYLIDEILEFCNFQKPVWWLNTVDTSVQGLQAAFRNLEDNRLHVQTGRAAYARSVADLMVGVNLSRHFTLENPDVLLTVGRVQTPTLGLVVQRDMQIENHMMVFYYTIVGKVTIDGKEVEVRYAPDPKDPNLEDGRILHKKYAEKILAELLKNPALTGEISRKKEREEPPLPFNKTRLSVYAEKNWGYNPAQTLQLTQTLRDNYNAISYNRSDCQYLLESQHAAAPGIMGCVISNINYRPKRLDMSIKSRAFNDKIVKGENSTEAHTAIIPQGVKFDISRLTEEERNIYLAICKYYMAQFLPPALKEKTKLTIPCPKIGGQLQAFSTKILDPGWRVCFREAKQEAISVLSDLAVGQYPVTLTDAEITEGHTNPPPRFTLATLEEAMSTISKYVEDPKIKDILLQKDAGKSNENGSIGTVATRPSIIMSLLDHQYIEPIGDGKKDNKIRSTPLGRELVRILPKELTAPELTAKWWCMQEDIKAGADENILISDVLNTIKTILATPYPKINTSIVPDRFKRRSGGGTREPLGACPRCGKPVVEGKIGYGCSGYKDGCKFVIWKTSKRPMFRGITFSAADAKKFLRGEPVLKKNLKKKDGGTFSAYLRMNYDPSSPYVDISPDFSLKTPRDTGSKGTGTANRRTGGQRRRKGGARPCGNEPIC